MKVVPALKGGDGPAQVGDEIDLMAFAGTLWRGKWIIGIYTSLAMVIGLVYVFVIATPIYEAQSVLALDSREQTLVSDMENVLSGLTGDKATINTELEILRSRILGKRMVERLDLLKDPEFNPTLEPPSPFDPVILIKTGLSAIGLLPPLEDAPLTEPEILDATVTKLAEAISVSNTLDSYVFNIVVRTTDPQKSALIADTLAELYIEDQLQVKFEATERAATWLSERVAELRSDLEASEEAAKEFNADINLIGPEALEGLNRQLKDMRDRLTDERVALDLAATRVEELNSVAATGAPQAMAAVMGDVSLANLATKAAQNPESRAAFDQRFATLRNREQIRLDRQTNQVNVLEASVAELSERVDSQSDDLVRLEQLQREAEADRLIYESFLVRLREISVQQGTQEPDARVLSAAVVPQSAAAPRKALVLAAAIFLGGMIGTTLVLLREMRSHGFRLAKDLERATGLTVLGQIPRTPHRTRGALITILKEKPNSPMAESARNLRTSVMLANVDKPPQVIMSTSSLPSEGKTTTSILLSHYLAALNKKVLLVECDIRRRVMSEYFDFKGTRGFVSVLSGNARLEDVRTHDRRMNIDVLPGEATPVNAADLFSSDRFADFIGELREQYDHIIVDTPPVLLVTDARIIAQLVDATLLNVKWDATTAMQVETALDSFRSANLRVHGLVLTQIDPKGVRRYGYGEYGGYGQQGSGYYTT
ncbi:MAG: polysaccharide biosynthesis tyrosine autokinase [Pseudomonadota bacterium]